MTSVSSGSTGSKLLAAEGAFSVMLGMRARQVAVSLLVNGFVVLS